MTILSQPQNYRAIQALGLLALVTALAWLLYPTSTTGQGQAGPGLEQRVAELEELLAHVHLVEGEINGLAGPHLIVEGCNLHVRNATGFTDEIDGTGNLIVGYNEIFTINEQRTGSHNFVVGRGHTYTNYGGFVAGERNAVTGAAASVSAGRFNEASGDHASVSAGHVNEASGDHASVSGGDRNLASGNFASVSGGADNEASGSLSSVSGGRLNEASGPLSSVSGGFNNAASDIEASVSGGVSNTATGTFASVSGGAGNEASGNNASVSGGRDNVASHRGSTVSGGVGNATAFDGDHVP